MSGSVTTFYTVALVAFTLVMLAFAVRRLRKETRLNARTVLIGAVVPLASTAAYIIFGGGGAQFATMLMAVAIGAVVGFALAWLTVIQHTASGVVVRQSGLTLIIWSSVYAATSLAGLLPDPRLRQATMLGLAAAAGMAAGSQLGLFIRSRSRAPAAAPAITYAQPAIPMWGSAPPPVAPPIPAPQPVLTTTATPALSAGPAQPVHFTHTGTRYLLGYTASFTAIWDRAAPDEPVAQFQRTVDGRATAWSQFTAWERSATVVAPYEGLPLAPIADVPVVFTHLGTRFAIGRTANGYGIWDRWAPGMPVAAFGADDQSALTAWQAFSSWEPAAVAL